MEAELREQHKKETELRAELRKTVEAELRVQILAEQAQHTELATFAAEVCGGDAGLAEKPEDVVAFLEQVPEAALEAARRMLKGKVVTFRELGSSRDGGDQKVPLPTAMTKLLEMWIGDGHKMAEFFEANKAELGEMGQYDLAAFVEK